MAGGKLDLQSNTSATQCLSSQLHDAAAVAGASAEQRTWEWRTAYAWRPHASWRFVAGWKPEIWNHGL